MKPHGKLFFLGISFVFICQLAFIPHGFGGKKPDETVALSFIPMFSELSTNNKFYTIDEKVRVESPNYRFLVKSPDAATAQAQGVKGTQVWLTGRAKSGFLPKAKGVTVKENVLKLPHFAPKAASKPEPSAQ